MQSLKKYVKNKYVLFTLLFAIVALLSWVVFRVLTATVEDSSWNGFVATSFKSGTGTKANPYVISSSSEFAYFKKLMESDSAPLYASKNYVITTGLNYGDHDITINNEIDFSGTIDGQGHTIYNANIVDSLFKKLSKATIKNLGFYNIDYALNDKQGGFLARDISSSTIEMVVIDSNITKGNDSYFVSGITHTSASSTYSNVIVNNKYVGDYNKDTTYNIAYTSSSDNYTNVITNANDYNNFNTGTYKIGTFKTNNNSIDIDSSLLNNLKTSEYEVILNKNEFVFQERTIESTPSGAKRGAYTEHATGADGTTLYINNLVI